MMDVETPLVPRNDFKWIGEVLGISAEEAQKRWEDLENLLTQTIKRFTSVKYDSGNLEKYPKLLRVSSDGTISGDLVIGILDGKFDYKDYLAKISDSGEKQLSELWCWIIQRSGYRPIVIGKYALFIIYKIPHVVINPQSKEPTWVKGIAKLQLHTLSEAEQEFYSSGDLKR